jgi:hypothetical protein
MAPFAAAAKVIEGASVMETFKGHKFWVGVLVGGAFVYWVLPRVMAMRAGGG